MHTWMPSGLLSAYRRPTVLISPACPMRKRPIHTNIGLWLGSMSQREMPPRDFGSRICGLLRPSGSRDDLLRAFQ